MFSGRGGGQAQGRIEDMQNRSWLLVPGDSERKLGKAMATGADIIVVDLADSVLVAAKNDARRMAVDWLNAHRRQILESRRLGRWVRINPFESRQWREDLIAVVRAAPDGIVLPNAASTEVVRQLAAELYELEQASQVPSGSIKIMPVLGSSVHSACAILSFADVSLPRLAGITWDADKLAQAIAATRKHDARLGWTAALGLVRAQALLVAHANGVFAVES
ncbi:MAG: aldolase/citrate lyase family protein, partial [Nevskiales bacterium]